jgi:hypothetical protein
VVFFLIKNNIYIFHNNDNFYEEKYNFLNKYQIKKGPHKMFLLFELLFFIKKNKRKIVPKNCIFYHSSLIKLLPHTKETETKITCEKKINFFFFFFFGMTEDY